MPRLLSQPVFPYSRRAAEDEKFFAGQLLKCSPTTRKEQALRRFAVQATPESPFRDADEAARQRQAGRVFAGQSGRLAGRPAGKRFLGRFAGIRRIDAGRFSRLFRRGGFVPADTPQERQTDSREARKTIPAQRRFNTGFSRLSLPQEYDMLNEYDS